MQIHELTTKTSLDSTDVIALDTGSVTNKITGANLAASLKSIGSLVTGVKGDNESTYRTGNVNISLANMGLNALVQTVHYTYSYTAAANGVVNITANDMGVSTPSGYTPIGIMVMSTGSGYCYYVTCNAGRTGNSTIAQIKNYSANEVSSQAQLDILYIKTAFV